MKNQDILPLHYRARTFVLYNCSKKAPDIQGFFPLLRAAFSPCCYKHTFFSRFLHSIYRKQSLSRRGHTRRLFCYPKNGKEVYVMVLKITPKQRTKINALVRKTCCNCYKGNCLLLDDGEETKCVQLISRYGIYCNYFLKAVLPAEKELYTEILRQNGIIG